MNIIAGLGNPGARYAHTPHNVGFMVMDVLAQRMGATFKASTHFHALIAHGRHGDTALLLVKPQTYMNNSGMSVGLLMRYFDTPLSGLAIVLDDADLDLGRIRIRAAGSDGGHRGLKSVIECVGSRDFTRVRLGIGRSREGTELVGHVLRPIEGEEKQTATAMIERAAEAVMVILEAGVETAMNRFNPAIPYEGA